LRILQKRHEMVGIPEQRYQSNFETVLSAFSVKASPRFGPKVLNHEDGRPTVLSVIESAFQRVDAFGLRIDLNNEAMQSVYTATLSALRFKANQSVQKGTGLCKEVEFSNSAPHYMRGTLLSDLRSAVKGYTISQGWFAVLFTK